MERLMTALLELTLTMALVIAVLLGGQARCLAAALLPSGGTGPGCSSRCDCCCPLASPCRSR